MTKYDYFWSNKFLNVMIELPINANNLRLT